MTNTRKKLRALFLAVLMVASVFGGTVALAGTAAAANEDLDAGSVSPSTTAAGNAATYTFEIDPSADIDAQTYEVEFGTAFDLANASDETADIVRLGVDTDDDGTIEEDFTSSSSNAQGVNSVSANNGVLTFDTSSSATVLGSGDVLIAEIRDVGNPTNPGDYPVNFTINPGSTTRAELTVSITGADTDFTADAPPLATEGTSFTVTGNLTNNGDRPITREVSYTDTNSVGTAADATKTITVGAGESETVAFDVSVPDGSDGSTVASTLTTNGSDGPATVETDITAEEDTAAITGDLRDIDGNRIPNASEVELVIEADPDGDGTFQEVEASPVTVSGENDEYTQQVPVQTGGTEYRVTIDPSQVENVTGVEYESFARTSLVEAGASERFDVRLVPIVNADDISVVDTDSPAVADGTDEASVTVQVTTDDLENPPQPFEGEGVSVSIVSATDDQSAVSLTSTRETTNSDGEATFSLTSSEAQDVTLEFETDNGLTVQQTVTFVPEDGEGVFVAQVKDKETAEELENATVYAVREGEFVQNEISFTNETNVAEDDEALFRVINEDTGQVVDNEDYDIRFRDSSDFVRVDELNESDAGVGEGFLGIAGPGSAATSGTGAFEFSVIPLEPGNYTVQSTDVGDTENPGEANFTNVSGAENVEVTQDLTAEAIAEQASQTDADPVAQTNENGQATLTGLAADGKTGVEYVVMAERADYARQYQDATIQSYDTDRNIVERTFLLEEREVEPDAVNITQIGVHPPISETGGAPDTGAIEPFNNTSDAFSQEVPRDRSIDVIEVSASATNFQGEDVPVDTNVTVTLNKSFDGQFLGTVLGGDVVSNDQENTTITVSTGEDGTATVLLQTEQNGSTLRAQKTATLEEDSSVTDSSNVTFRGTVVFDSGSISGIVTNEDNEPIVDSVVYVEEFTTPAGDTFTIEPTENISDTDRQGVRETEFVVTDESTGDNVTVTGEELEDLDIESSFTRVTTNVSSYTLLTFPSQEQGQAQYTLPRVPAQNAGDGVQYDRVAGIELDSGIEGVGDTDSGVKVDFTQEANVVIRGAVPTTGNFQVSDLSAPSNVSVNETFAVSATITNDDVVETTQTVEFRVSPGTLTQDTVLVTREVTLGPGENTTVTFDGLAIGDAGEYNHGVFTADSSATATITVEESEETIVEQFDADNDGDISPGEAQDAISALNNGEISPLEAQQIIAALNS